MKVKVPTGLGKRGKAFWAALTEKIEYAVQESEVLVEACRTLDRIDELTEAVQSDGVMISGSMGQRILHPAIGELRQQQASFVRLVGALHLPEDEQAKDKFHTARAKAGAAGRWGSLSVMG
ncbi:hypothetical protein ACTU6V_12450 [Microbacterium sp. A204]|uniref:hypothetical protein n=1 Tax=Microbacterium sp. A204 TaxID=3457321 RepID=UPI003FD2AE8A